MKRIALSGYYGFGNAGDEAVLAGLVRAIRSVPGGGSAAMDICALSIDPAATRKDQGISSAHRYKIGQLLHSLAGCDLLASGGGSLLQDVTSRHSIFYYLGVVRAAQIMGKRTMLVAQGIGPLQLPRSRNLTASVAKRCDAVTVRDTDSAALLQELGIDPAAITVTADPALLLGEPSVDRRGSGVAVSVRPWSGAPPGFIESVADACFEAIGAPVVSSMMMSPDDAMQHDEFFDEYNRRCGLAEAARHEKQPIAWNILSAVSAHSELVIGMRLHALILAAANGVPSVALSYDPKVAAFMEQIGQTDAVYDIRQADPGKLTALVRRVWLERQDRAASVTREIPRLAAAARRNAEIAVGLLT